MVEPADVIKKADGTLTGSPGRIYAKIGALSVSGNSGTDQLNATIAVGTVSITGNGSIVIMAPTAHLALVTAGLRATSDWSAGAVANDNALFSGSGPSAFGVRET
jgi:hypothetical protein